MPEPPSVALVLATSTGGIGQHVRSVAAGLAERGHGVRVLGPAATERLFGFSGAGARFRPVEIATGPRPLADVRAAVRLRRLTDGVDVVHAHGLRAGLLCGVAVARRVPLVVTWHNAVLGSRLRRAVYRALERIVARRADVTLAASADLAERARSLGGRDVRTFDVAAPALPSPSRSAAETRALLEVDGPLVVCVGRLHPQKGHEVLIEAAALLAARGRRAAAPLPTVVIAGEGPQRHALEQRIAATRAPVRLLGRRTDVADLLAAADVVVLASRWEARALVAQEALRAGVPLVATAVGGVPDLVGGAAELVPPDDPAALALAVERVLGDPVRAETMRRAGRERAASWQGEVEGIAILERLYLDLTSRRS